MGLADDLAELPTNPWYKGCGVTKSLQKLEDDDRIALLDALDNPSITHVFLARLLNKHGYNVGADAVRRHRNNECCKDDNK